jgi:hypothetical protein
MAVTWTDALKFDEVQFEALLTTALHGTTC